MVDIQQQAICYVINIIPEPISKKFHFVLTLQRLHLVVYFLNITLIPHVKPRTWFIALAKWLGELILNLLNSLIGHSLNFLVLRQGAQVALESCW